MTAECVIRRATGGTVTNPDFTVTPEYGDVYIGKCKPQSFRPQESTPEVAGATSVVIRSEVHLPVGALQVLAGDIITIIASVDPLLVGRSYRVAADEPTVEHATAYRVPVTRVVGEEVRPWTP